MAQTELVTDASGNSVGCVLQQTIDQATTPLGFWSNALAKHQFSWSTYERELFACYASLKHFRHLEAKDFFLFTDHKPVVTKFYSNTRAASPRQERFFDFTSQMTNDVRHVEGKECVADVFSRPIDPPAFNAILPARPGIDYEQIAKAQRLDPDLQETSLDNPTSLSLKKVPLGNTGIALLCDDSHGRLRPVIPSSMRLEVFRHFYSGSHPGIKAGIRNIGRLVVWYDNRRNTTRWTRECQQCARSEIGRHNNASLDPVTPPPRDRSTHIYVDLTGPLCPSKGHNYVVAVVDRYSRFFQVFRLLALRWKNAQTRLSGSGLQFLAVRNTFIVIEARSSSAQCGAK